MRDKTAQVILSEPDQKLLSQFENAVEFAIETNKKGLQAGQTLYIDSELKLSRQVAGILRSNLRKAGWKHVRLYEDENGKTVIELARSTFGNLFKFIFHVLSGRAARS
ncbi:MAG: hypothetical protein J0I20_16835 [Chloroflexi bacterium]|nr:hypothetical protein [Chloroflexota bacterium]OJV88804.1 MAG: hypothetical protein BGO39_04715 [Chloroflexi bacterium 54-19]